MRCPHRVSLWLLILTLVASWPAVALSIFDVIQLSENGYDDSRIIDLIEATNSVFELEAEDVSRLARLGVSEAVIRVMLERVPEEQPSGGSQLGGAHEETGGGLTEHTDHEESPGAEHRAVEGDRAAPGHAAPPRTTADVSPVRAAEPLVSFHPIEEERGGDHLHMVLTLSGLEVLILRDKGPFRSMRARALEVAQRLEAALTLGDGTCYAVSAGWGPAVVFQSAATHQRLTIIEITAADARAYEIRSGRPVTPDLLAAYWADLLSDFVAISMARRPSRILTLHDGDALGVLYQALKRTAGQGGGLRAAAELLPNSVRHHLERLAVAVPVDYDRREKPAY